MMDITMDHMKMLPYVLGVTVLVVLLCLWMVRRSKGAGITQKVLWPALCVLVVGSLTGIIWYFPGIGPFGTRHAAAPEPVRDKAAPARDRAIVRRPEESGQPRRVALVMGNVDYPEAHLKNAVNDAADMGRVLRKMGYEVFEAMDVGHRAMESAVNRFTASLDSGSVGLFFYAGHGVQVEGKNYLIPVDFPDGASASDAKYKAMDANYVLDKMAESGNAINVVILDACRNNPFMRSRRGLAPSRGLARMDAPSGTLIAYSTAPGDTASDGDGRNGVFTQHLLQRIQQPGMTINDILLDVTSDVKQDTNGHQVPWQTSSLDGRFYPAGEAKIAVSEEEKWKKRLEAERAKWEAAQQHPQADAPQAWKPLRALKPGEVVWAEPRSMYPDTNRKLYLRRDALGSVNPAEGMTMRVSREESGLVVDASGCDHAWRIQEKRVRGDPPVAQARFFLTPSELRQGAVYWTVPGSIFITSDRKAYLSRDARLHPVRLRPDMLVKVRRSEQGFVLDMSDLPKGKPLWEISGRAVASGDQAIAKVVTGN